MTRMTRWMLALALIVLPLAAAPTASAAICFGSSCPGGFLMCMDGDVGAARDCLEDSLPPVNCAAIQYADETVGPFRVTVGGCGARVFYEGEPVLP